MVKRAVSNLWESSQNKRHITNPTVSRIHSVNTKSSGSVLKLVRKLFSSYCEEHSFSNFPLRNHVVFSCWHGILVQYISSRFHQQCLSNYSTDLIHNCKSILEGVLKYLRLGSSSSCVIHLWFWCICWVMWHVTFAPRLEVFHIAWLR